MSQPEIVDVARSRIMGPSSGDADVMAE
jgi:hypothetical protein